MGKQLTCKYSVASWDGERATFATLPEALRCARLITASSWDDAVIFRGREIVAVVTVDGETIIGGRYQLVCCEVEA